MFAFESCVCLRMCASGRSRVFSLCLGFRACVWTSDYLFECEQQKQQRENGFRLKSISTETCDISIDCRARMPRGGILILTVAQ